MHRLKFNVFWSIDCDENNVWYLRYRPYGDLLSSEKTIELSSNNFEDSINESRNILYSLVS